MNETMEFDLGENGEKNEITAGDVLDLRRALFGDGTFSQTEAERLIALDERCKVKDPSWADFYVEALTDYLVHQAEPRGYVTKENADWLIERISKDGIIESRTELELLVHVLDAARWTPPSFSAFALAQVRHAVLHGSGPLRTTGEQQEDADAVTADAGAVTADDVALLRRILYAFGGDENIAVSMAEAEILLDIDEATAGADNAPEWRQLFVQAMANAVMAASGYQVPSREEALRREAWLEEREGVGDFISGMVDGGVSAILGAYRDQSAEQRALAHLEEQRKQIVTAEAITAIEADWLADRIGRDGTLSENEEALLCFIKTQSPRIHPALAPLLDRVETHPQAG